MRIAINSYVVLYKTKALTNLIFRSEIESCMNRLETKGSKKKKGPTRDVEKKWCDTPEYQRVKVNSVERKRTNIVRESDTEVFNLKAGTSLGTVVERRLSGAP